MYISVAQRQTTPTKKRTGYIPVAQRKPTEQNIPFSLETNLLGVQTTTPMFTEDITIQKAVGGLAKEVGQSMARNIRSTFDYALKPALEKVGFEAPEVGKKKDFLTQEIEKRLYGDLTSPEVTELTGETRAEQLKPLDERIAKSKERIIAKAEDYKKLSETPGLSSTEKFVISRLSKILETNAGSFAFAVISGYTGLDLTFFGGSSKNVFKAMVKAKTLGEATEILLKMGVADDLARQFAKDVMKVADEKTAKKLFNNIANLQQTTKVAPKVIPKIPTEPLAPSIKDYEALAPKIGLTIKEVEAIKTTRAGIDVKALGQVYVKKSADGTRILEITKGAPKDRLAHEIGHGLHHKYPNILSKPADRNLWAGYSRELSRIADDRIKEFRPFLDELIESRKALLREPVHTPAVKKEYNRITRQINEVRELFKEGFRTQREKGAEFISIFFENQKLAKSKYPILSKIFQEDIQKIPELKNFYTQVVKGAREISIPEGLPKLPRITTEGIPGVRGLKKVGLAPEVPKKITKTEPQLLKAQVRAEARTAKQVATEVKGVEMRAAKRQVAVEKRAGKLKVVAERERILTKLRATTQATDEIKDNIITYAKDNLSSADRGKALTIVRDAKTQKNLTKAFARINRWAEEAEKKTIRNEILKTQKKIIDSSSVAIDYKARVKELMGDFELKGHRETTLERLKNTQKFLEEEAAKGGDVEMPRRILKSLELLNRTPFEQITTSQLKGLQAEMELLEDIGKTKLRVSKDIWKLQKEKILSEITTQGAKPIQNIELIKPEIGERLTLTQKFKNLIWRTGNEAMRIDKAISPMDTIFDLLDGGKGLYDGANFRFFKGQVDAGYGRYITRKDALQNPVVELANKYKLEDVNFERMGVVAAREQDGGVEKLLASGFTEKQIDAIKLTSQEKEVLDLMRKTFDSQFPEIKDTMRRVYNQPVEKVKNYFSFMTDWKAMDESEVFQRFGSQLPEQYGTPRKNIEAGFTKTRVGGEQKIKINALDVFLQHTDNTSYLLELGETSKMLGEVAASPRYAELVGEAGQLLVREWIDVIARKGGAAGASEIAVLNTLRKNVGIGILGLKLSTIAIQPTAFIDGMGFIGIKYGRKGFTNFASSSEWRKFIGNMPEIKDRMGGEFALRELTDDNWLQNIQRKGFIPMQALDQMTAGAVAAGAYERKMIELGRAVDLTKPFDKEALAYAQLAVRRTQSSGAFKDVPLAVSRGALTGNRSLDRAILQFQNFLLTRWSRIRHDAIRAGVNTKDPKKAIPVLMAIIFASLAASGIRLGVNKTVDFITGREDKDTIAEDLEKGFYYEMTGNVPFLGTAVSMAMYDGEMFPILDAPKGVISGLNRVITSESEGAKLRGFTEFAGSTGALLGIPGSAQAEQFARGFLQEEKKSTPRKTLKTPPGLPSLPSIKGNLPKLPKLPSLSI